MAGALRTASDGDVRSCLERALGAAVVAMERRQFAYATSFAIDELDVELADGQRLELLVKDLGPDGRAPAAVAAKPSFLADPAREIAVYRDVLAPAGQSTPSFHGAWVDETAGRWWLFLERVEGEVLFEVGELEVWCEVAEWLARLRAAVPVSAGGPLVDRDEQWHRLWTGRAIEAADRSAHPRAGELAMRLRGSVDRLVERLVAQPRAFVHGELYPSNVVVVRGADGATRVAPVDWELAGSGPYGLDVAALVSGWSREDRAAMCDAYLQALPAGERAGVSLDRLAADVDACRLALAVQWIGWAPGWEPPEAHRHDWIAEAAALLDEVEL